MLYADPSDLFRSVIKKYWHMPETELVFNGDDAPGSPVMGPYSVIGLHRAPQYDIAGSIIKRVIVGPGVLRTEPLWYNYKLSVKIIGDNSEGLIEDDDAWRSIVLSNIETGTEFVDHVFHIDLPLSNRESSAVKSSAGQLAGDVEYIYNYYERGYEEFTVSTSASERLLPNMYVFASALMASDDTIDYDSPPEDEDDGLELEEEIMAKKKGQGRQMITLECTEQKNSGVPGMSRYTTMKNKKNTPKRMELKKYNSFMRKHTVHKEIK